MQNTHQHGPDCGHKRIIHGSHADYLTESGMLECETGVHPVAVSEKNPDQCQPVAEASHVHGANCGHAKVMHGNHIDYLVDGRLEHPHGDHNDNHGQIG
jgi:hypothetical protein